MVPTTRFVLPASALLTTCLLTPSSQLRFVLTPKLELLKMANTSGSNQLAEGEEEEEMADKSRSPSPPHPIFSGPVVRLFIYPPPPATGGITVTNEDFYCLNEGEFLNDVIIDFYLKYMILELLNVDERTRTHIFSSFFYRRLTQKESRVFGDDTGAHITLQQRRHQRVKTWTRHVDLFSKDFIMVPINESAHWYLAVICFPGLRTARRIESKTSTPAVDKTLAKANDSSETVNGTGQVTSAKADVGKSTELLQAIEQPCILIFDSLMSPHYGVIRTLREYLQEEWNVRKAAHDGPREFTKDSCPGANVRCPQQTNFSDCGVYVLQYAESFFKSPVINFAFPFVSLLDWFPEELVLKKRDELRQLVLNLQHQLNPDLQYDPREGTVPAHKTSEPIDTTDPPPAALIAESTASSSIAESSQSTYVDPNKTPVKGGDTTEPVPESTSSECFLSSGVDCNVSAIAHGSELCEPTTVVVINLANSTDVSAAVSSDCSPLSVLNCTVSTVAVVASQSESAVVETVAKNNAVTINEEPCAVCEIPVAESAAVNVENDSGDYSAQCESRLGGESFLPDSSVTVDSCGSLPVSCYTDSTDYSETLPDTVLPSSLGYQPFTVDKVEMLPLSLMEFSAKAAPANDCTSPVWGRTVNSTYVYNVEQASSASVPCVVNKELTSVADMDISHFTNICTTDGIVVLQPSYDILGNMGEIHSCVEENVVTCNVTQDSIIKMASDDECGKIFT
jgi:hypothetical protein